MEEKRCEIPGCDAPATRLVGYRRPPTHADEVEQEVGLAPPERLIEERMCDEHRDAVAELYGDDAIEIDDPIVPDGSREG